MVTIGWFEATAPKPAPEEPGEALPSWPAPDEGPEPESEFESGEEPGVSCERHSQAASTRVVSSPFSKQEIANSGYGTNITGGQV